MKKIFPAFLLIFTCFCFIEAQEQTEKVEMVPVNISASCSMFVVGWEGKVFQDGETLNQAIVNGKLNCAKEKIPEIDFGKYTLIGAGTNVGGCPAGSTFVLTVEKDNEKKLYLVKTFRGSNPCRGLSYTARWVLVPKLTKGYEVKFEEEKAKGPF